MRVDKIILRIICMLCVSILLLSGSSLYADGRVVIRGVSCFVPLIDTTSEDVKYLNCGHYKQTTDYTCGAAAVMNLLYYYKMLSASEMNKQTELRISKEMGTTDDGTSLSQMETWLSNNGFTVDSGEMISSDTIIRNINNGIPTIIAFSKHWMLAHGYNSTDNPENSYLIFSDSSTGTTMIHRDEIDTMWAAAQMPRSRTQGDIGYYIIAVPNKHR